MSVQFDLWHRPPPSARAHALRPYQVDAKEAFYAGVRAKRKRQLVVLPTGTGKTTTIGAIAADWPGRVLVAAPRREIVHQNRDELALMSGEPCGVEMADERAGRERLVSASISTLAYEARRAKFTLYPPSLLVIDEAHHATAPSYRRVIDAFPDATLVGFTATPDRGDGKALGQVFTHVAHQMTIEDAVADGWLVGLKTARDESVEIDLSSIKTKGGDFDEAGLDAEMLKHARTVATAAVELCGDLKTIVFATRVETAHVIAQHINALAGRRCAVAIDGGMSDQRDLVMEAFKRGEFQFLVNVGIAVEGFNDPSVRAMVNARPTKSRGLFTQMVGRILRPARGVIDGIRDPRARRAAIAASGKPWALVVNLAYVPGRHTLIGPEDVLGGRYDEEEKERARKVQQEEDVTVEESLEKARAWVNEQRRMQAAIAEAIKERARIMWGEFDPFAAFALQLDLPGNVNPGDLPRASKDQLVYLARKSVKAPPELTKVEATKLIRTIIKREQLGLSTLNQVEFLTRNGVDPKAARKMSWVRANDVMIAIQRNGGRVPRDMAALAKVPG